MLKKKFSDNLGGYLIFMQYRCGAVSYTHLSGGAGGSGGSKGFSGGGHGPGSDGAENSYRTYLDGTEGIWNNVDQTNHKWAFVLNSGTRIKDSWANIRYNYNGSSQIATYHFDREGIMDSGWFFSTALSPSAISDRPL